MRASNVVAAAALVLSMLVIIGITLLSPMRNTTDVQTSALPSTKN